jgi:hypothetical protein
VDSGRVWKVAVEVGSCRICLLILFKDMEQSPSLYIIEVDEYDKWLVLVVDKADFSCGRKRNEK